jgi:hypothetical protein
MRRWDVYGLDSPSDFESITTCIDDSENYIIPIGKNGDPLPSGVDVIKAAMSYYDMRHENGTAIDNINIHLQEKIPVGGGLYIWDTKFRFTCGSTDEKERIYYSGNLGGRTFRFVVSGADVTSDNAGCGTNSMRVHFAWFYEDSSRDDSDGPNSEIEPE